MVSDTASWIVHEIRKHGEQCTMNAIESVIAWLYDSCPVDLNEVSRDELREMYLNHLRKGR